ncbi:MAG: hypothetical protein HN368_19530 [Spirochaetales bacterium]|nr:hypothetical protein [Spirochaetales bacterium]
MMIRKTLIFTLLIAVLLSSCDLFVGGRGPTGRTGGTGSSGSLWYTGENLPDEELGNDGDYYLITIGGSLYQKIDGEWSYIGNITGADGLDGKNWLAGTAHPDDSSEGVNGDFYLETDTGNTYIKSAGIWTFNSNIEGKKEFQLLISVHSNNNPQANVNLNVDGADYGGSGNDGVISLSFDTVGAVNIGLSREFFTSVNYAGITPQEDLNPLPLALEISPQIFFPDPGGGGVIRVDDMTGANPVAINSINGTAFVAPHWVEVDYENGWIYVIDNNEAGNAGSVTDLLFRFDEFTELEQNAQILTLDITTMGTDIPYASQIALTDSSGLYLAHQDGSTLFYFPNVEDFSTYITDSLIITPYVAGLTVSGAGDVIWSVAQTNVSDSNIQKSSTIMDNSAVLNFTGAVITQGSAINELTGPTRLFTDSNYLYISDTGDSINAVDPFYNHRIVRYDLAGTNPVSYGAVGSGIGQFDFPVLMGLLPDNKLYILDMGNDRIVCIDADSFDGTGWEEFAAGVDLIYFLDSPGV